MMVSQAVAEVWRFLKMASVRHFGCKCVFGPLTKRIWWSLSLCTVWLESTL